VKAGNGDVVVLEELRMEVPKTREMAALLDRFRDGESALLLLVEHDEIVEKSARNLPDVKTLRANYLNIRDLLGYDKIVLTMDTLDLINGFLGAADEIQMVSDEAGEEE
jgi:large subunit ribosomal protein L4